MEVRQLAVAISSLQREHVQQQQQQQQLGLSAAQQAQDTGAGDTRSHSPLDGPDHAIKRLQQCCCKGRNVYRLKDNERPCFGEGAYRHKLHVDAQYEALYQKQR